MVDGHGTYSSYKAEIVEMVFIVEPRLRTDLKCVVITVWYV